MKRALMLAITLSVLASPQPPSACTTFCFLDEGQVIFGKNYDWNVDDGHLIVNKRGVSRSALASAEAGHGARWRSKYGSVTFNQYGRDFPSGGMNEYEESLAFLARTREAGRPAPEGVQSLHRFARTAERVGAYRKKEPEQAVAHAFTTLGAAANETTQWSIVYDAGGQGLHFKTRGQPEIRSLNLATLDFACASPVMMVDMNAKGHGDLTNALLPWSVEANIGLVRGAYARTGFLSDVPETEILLVGRAPLAATCAQVSGNGGAP